VRREDFGNGAFISQFYRSQQPAGSLTKFSLPMTNRALAIVSALAVFAVFAPFRIGRAQRAHPIGVVLHQAHSASKDASAVITSHRESAWKQSGFWTWTGIGTLVGGIAGAIWAGVEIRKSDDPMLPGLGFAIGIGAGAVAGALLGAFTYTLSHSTHDD
ncbi:MAG TPA: hypothetical protein VE110_06605, partial [Gemmatimonadaceae bacterium]|nr:hypothetical protein [Gemmatimonadaceae bacterium]